MSEEKEESPPSKKELAIVIVVYNNADLVIHQINCIRKFCKDDCDIIVIDNSDKQEVIAPIRYHAIKMGCEYIKTQSSSRNSSSSHAFASNLAYRKFAGMYNYYFFLDHDNFPLRDFSVKEILKDKVMAGLGQVKPSGKKYFWAGCVMWDANKVDSELIDFSPNKQYGLDTGGNLYMVIDKYGDDACVFFNEVHHENPNFTKSFYNFYAEINDSMFMHFVNSSNWANSNDNQERINSLVNILQSKTGI